MLYLMTQPQSSLNLQYIDVTKTKDEEIYHSNQNKVFSLRVEKLYLWQS